MTTQERQGDGAAVGLRTPREAWPRDRARETRETVRVRDVEDLACIYDDAVSVVVWERTLPASLAAWLDGVRSGGPINLAARVAPGRHEVRGLFGVLEGRLGGPGFDAWREDVVAVARVCADLFESDVVGVRLSTVTTHCQRFHVDRITARLVTTYAGAGTEWVDDDAAVRAMLGHADPAGEPHAAVVTDERAIRRMGVGEIGVLKGDAWPGREGRGVMHRSPPYLAGDPPRLLLTVEALER